MKLNELIEYLRDPGKLDQLYEEESVNMDTEALEIYLKGALSLDSEIKFFGIEETGDNLIFEKDGSVYVQLFPVDYAIEVLDFLGLSRKDFDKFEAAKRLLEYREKDA